MTTNNGKQELRCNYFLDEQNGNDAGLLYLTPMDADLTEHTSLISDPHKTPVALYNGDDEQGILVYTGAVGESLDGWRVVFTGQENDASGSGNRDHQPKRMMAVNSSGNTNGDDKYWPSNSTCILTSMKFSWNREKIIELSWRDPTDTNKGIYENIQVYLMTDERTREEEFLRDAAGNWKSTKANGWNLEANSAEAKTLEQRIANYASVMPLVGDGASIVGIFVDSTAEGPEQGVHTRLMVIRREPNAYQGWFGLGPISGSSGPARVRQNDRPRLGLLTRGRFYVFQLKKDEKKNEGNTLMAGLAKWLEDNPNPQYAANAGVDNDVSFNCATWVAAILDKAFPGICSGTECNRPNEVIKEVRTYIERDKTRNICIEQNITGYK